MKENRVAQYTLENGEGIPFEELRMQLIEEHLRLQALDSLRPTLEEKIIRSFEETTLAPSEITSIVEWALGEFTPGVLGDYVDEAFDIIYEAIEKALERGKS